MKRFFQIARYLLLFAIACLLLWVSFRGVHWADFYQGLKSADYGWIAASMTIGITAFLVRAARWRLIMLPLGKKVRLRDSWHGVNIGYLTNFAVPRAGEIARCGVISSRSGIAFESVAGTVVLERSIDMLTLIIIFFSVMFLSWDRFGTFLSSQILEAVKQKFSVSIIWIAGAIVLSLIVFLYIIFRYRKKHP
ncbi:MAG: flippase-like domain-containing protein, partial [Bacteroidales bacterium]|nr:flippase-like domain-containing protein [Bacteroidales bacterium]